ncbi:hypothetical protein [Chitinophaga lutea]|uniref:hypothetical protein n=1 Tax=Chitinophaga lutea TaxID=2488634 RepID=UPI00131541CD|nr:hypothetical protein [Chitinophaga lutea]
MRKWTILLALTAGILFTGCRTQKTGCKTPPRNMGAEKVFDEMNKPPKKGLFRRRG